MFHPSAVVGLRPLNFPYCPGPAVLDRLLRLPERQPGGDVAGRLLWLPRLGVTVLPHEHVAEGWLCTMTGADSRPHRLPPGVFLVADFEVRTAFTADRPTAELETPEFCDAWRVRLAVHGGNPMLGDALIAHLDPADRTVATADRTVRTRSGARTAAGFRQVCHRLHTAGLLTALFTDDTGDTDSRRRYRLTLPTPTWPR
ncbi:hypothetical protein [Pseudonocardia lacus]|uniref:hypothetical protein n=1 Tax=Pseudonocardia lacus TaxID=2835865 RepID=UPI001BDD8BEC|nr:hypothetical protein [Pseudonocardia lacus]